MRNEAGLLLLFVLVASAGCSGLSPAGPEIPTGSEAADGYSALDTVEGTVEYRHQSSEKSSNTTLRVLKRPKQGMTRQEFLAPSSLTGGVTVTNGSVYWLYDASENRATRTSLDDSGPSNTRNAAFVQQVFSNLSKSGEGSVVTEPPLPVGPLIVDDDGPDVTSADVLGPTQFTVEYVGTETVADRQTHAVELDPVNETDVGTPGSYIENATYWFDSEYFYPLKVTTAISIDGDVSRNTRLYRNVSFDPEVTSGRFQFDPPPNATVRTQAVPKPESYDSVADADADVPFEVTKPDVPAGFDLETARVSRFRNRTTVSLNYVNATQQVTIATRNPPLDTNVDGDTVSLGTVDATTTSFGNLTVLRWQCGDLGYTVRGNVSSAELRDITRDVATNCLKRN